MLLISILCFVAHTTGLPAQDADGSSQCNGTYTCVSTSACLQRHDGGGNLTNGIIFQCGGGKAGNENVCCPAVRPPPSGRPTSRRPETTVYQAVFEAVRPAREDNLKQHKNYNLLPNSLCGSQTSDRISNGQDADLGQFPWMALLGYTDPLQPGINFYCAGTLLNDRYILTAAKCVNTAEDGIELKRVRLGELDLTLDPDCADHYCADSYTDYDVERVTSHPAYNTTTLRNDIALVRLKTRVPRYTDYVGPICLPFDLVNITGGEEATYTVAGWGKTEYTEPEGSRILRSVTVTSSSVEDCNALRPRGNRPHLTKRQLCARGETGNDLCKGSSGAPLMHTKHPSSTFNPQVAQIGVVSYGVKNCGSGAPTVFTRVSAYLKWILDNISS